MVEIIPAIIGQEFAAIREKVAAVEGLVNWVQLDIVDGLFAPNWTVNNPEELKTLPGKLKLEAHLMIEKPENFLTDWLPAVDRITIHFEATNRLAEIIDQFENLPIKLGLAVLPETPLEKLDPYLPRLTHLQLMGIKQIGFHHQPLEETTFDRIIALRQKSPRVTIAVDGGVNLENAPRLIAAGADQLVVGSAIWDSDDIAAAIKKFQNVI